MEAKLPLIVHWSSVSVPSLSRPPPYPEVLPLMMQLVSVAVPALYTPPPIPVVEPRLIVRPERDAVTFGSIWSTRSISFPSMVTSPASGPSIVIIPPVLLRSSRPEVRVIVCGVEKTAGAKVIVRAPAMTSARLTAPRRSSTPGGALPLSVATPTIRRSVPD